MILAPITALLAAAAPAPTWFVCDGIDRPVAYVATRADATGRITLTRIDKASGERTTTAYTIGRDDPGAGQIHNALIQDGREVGDIHRFNPGMAPDGVRATTPTVTSLTLDGIATQCRWLGGTRLEGITARRGVSIVAVGGQLTYRTFDFARPGPVLRPDGVQRMARPSLVITGGTGLRTPGGGREYRFAASGWRYVVAVSAAGAAEVRVMRGGRTVQRERFIAAVVAG
jgi:hypothetical protein